jgi:hypothetical protein
MGPLKQVLSKLAEKSGSPQKWDERKVKITVC